MKFPASITDLAAIPFHRLFLLLLPLLLSFSLPWFVRSRHSDRSKNSPQEPQNTKDHHP